jgi:hypothetical protein
MFGYSLSPYSILFHLSYYFLLLVLLLLLPLSYIFFTFLVHTFIVNLPCGNLFADTFLRQEIAISLSVLFFFF